MFFCTFANLISRAKCFFGTIFFKNSQKSATVRCYKNVECHFFVATILGLASDLILVVVKKRFRCGFWIDWTLAFRKKMVPECNPSTPNISYDKGGWRGKCWKVVFCITDLWTKHIKKFEHAANDFVPNVLSVKNTPWNPCIAFLSDPLFNFNMAQHVFLSKKFRKNLKSFCLWGKLFWHGKMKEKRVGKDAYCNWKRQFFFWRKQPLEESFWTSIIQATYINKQNWRVPFLRFTIPCFWVSGSLKQASMQTFQELEELFWEVPKKFCMAHFSVPNYFE